MLPGGRLGVAGTLFPRRHNRNVWSRVHNGWHKWKSAALDAMPPAFRTLGYKDVGHYPADWGQDVYRRPDAVL